MILSAKCSCKHCGRITEVDRLMNKGKVCETGDSVEIIWECYNCQKENEIFVKFM